MKNRMEGVSTKVTASTLGAAVAVPGRGHLRLRLPHAGEQADRAGSGVASVLARTCT